MKREKEVWNIHVVHTFGTVFDDRSEVLVLGSFPSVKIRESISFITGIRKTVLKVTAGVFGEDIPQMIDREAGIFAAQSRGVWTSFRSARWRCHQTAQFGTWRRMICR